MAQPIYIFAGGGTGGHLMPALAVAEKLAALRADARVVFACADRDIDRRILSATPYAFTPQPVRPMPRGARGWGAFLRRWSASRRLARRLVRDLQPAAVFGLGGFAAAPVVLAAAAAGVRAGLLSIDALPGLANRRLAGKVDVIFAQFAETVAAYGRHAGKVRVVGCPVRTELTEASPDEARKAFGLRDDRKTLLIVAGSLGAVNISQAVGRFRDDLELLAPEWQVLHVAGPGNLDRVQAIWAGSRVVHVVMEFCDRMDLAYAAADLVLCRAGAATIGELRATATPAVLMPYPYHRDRHQDRNAAALVAAGAAVVVKDTGNWVGNVSGLCSELLPILRREERLGALSEAAAGGTRTDAVEEIARWLCG